MVRGAVRAVGIGLVIAWFASPGPAAGQTLQERLGHPATARLLILHADDLGMSHSVNRATLEALEKGWITSASILVPCPWFPEAARWARAHPDADLGIHLALNSEWADFRWGPISPVSEVKTLLDADGYFPLEEPAVVANAKIPEVERELKAQVDKARAAGIRLSHLDSHMATLFRSSALFDAYRRIGAAYGLPVLVDRVNRAPAGSTVPDNEILLDRLVTIDPGVPLNGWKAAYEKMLSPLPPGVYQLIVHLAYSDDEMRGATRDHPDWGAAWRQADLELLRSPEFRDYLKREGFVLVGWKDLAKARSTSAR